MYTRWVKNGTITFDHLFETPEPPASEIFGIFCAVQSTVHEQSIVQRKVHAPSKVLILYEHAVLIMPLKWVTGYVVTQFTKIHNLLLGNCPCINR